MVPNNTYSLNTTLIKEYVYLYGIIMSSLFLIVYPGLGFVESYINASVVSYMDSGKCWERSISFLLLQRGKK